MQFYHIHTERLSYAFPRKFSHQKIAFDPFLQILKFPMNFPYIDLLLFKIKYLIILNVLHFCLPLDIKRTNYNTFSLPFMQNIQIYVINVTIFLTIYLQVSSRDNNVKVFTNRCFYEIIHKNFSSMGVNFLFFAGITS